MKRLRVGYFKHDQNWNRNICCHHYEGIQLVKVYPFSRVLFALGRRIGCRSQYLENTYFGPTWPHADVLHVWRTVCLTRRPWVVTSSVGLPFGWPRERWSRAIRAIAGSSCRKVIFNSNHALQWQLRKLSLLGAPQEQILRKTTILPTPQKLLVSSYDEKDLGGNNGAIRFMLVGHEFFRKGGAVLLKALDVIRREGVPVHVTVVSRLKQDEFLHVDVAARQETREYLQTNSWVTWYDCLPNEKVLELFRRSHIGVLLSFAEAYGYSVLEAQAAGCAMLTTDIGALPELNTPECGWTLPIRDIAFDLYDASSLWRLQDTMVERLVPLCRAIVKNRSAIREKGMRALEKIHKEHNPEEHRAALERIYFDAAGQNAHAERR